MSDIAPGYGDLHPEEGFNFMLNRMSWTIPKEELKETARPIESIDDWVQVMWRAATQAEADGRLEIASKYYQGAEFYMAPDHPDKATAYRKFVELYDQARPEMAALRVNVPYLNGFLPAFDVPAKGEEKGVIIAHSGFDGLVEEMYPALEPLVEAGYRVIAFEGPGQGGALRLSHLPMPFDWEKPVKAVLDHFKVDSCTLIGMSLGGYLAPRAAAFEPRIKRLVAWGAMYDFLGCFKARVGDRKFKSLKRLLSLGAASLINAAIRKAGRDDTTSRWAIGHGMHVCGAQDPYGFFKWLSTMNLRDVSHLIRQDTLIVMGAEDHLVPVEQMAEQAAALTHARSVTTRLLTAKEHGAQHCQIGNPLLVTDTILRWMEGLDQRDSVIGAASGKVSKAA